MKNTRPASHRRVGPDQARLGLDQAGDLPEVSADDAVALDPYNRDRGLVVTCFGRGWRLGVSALEDKVHRRGLPLGDVAGLVRLAIGLGLGLGLGIRLGIWLGLWLGLGLG